LEHHPCAVRVVPAPDVRGTSGSRLIFTDVRQDFIDGTDFPGAEALYRQCGLGAGVWRCGLVPEGVDGLLREDGWSEREPLGRAEQPGGYLAPAGRDVPVAEIERCVEPEKG
jgi:hypothetical protein